jgi:mRNA interferase MazF
MNFERGDVVIAADPFKDSNISGRPFLVINRRQTPFHGEQYITLSLTTRTCHDERLSLTDNDWIEGGAPESSSIMPWSVYSVKTDWITYRQGTLDREAVDNDIQIYLPQKMRL